jgi:hypothetical protein
MFATDSLGEFNFVLEFNLPKEISDNQEHIKLSVNRVDVPVINLSACPLGYKSTPVKASGEIYCIEHYKYIKDALPLINRWVNSVWSPCNKLHTSRSNLLVEAKLYAYKNDGSLFNKWSIKEFYPLFNPKIEHFYDDVVELKFKFENIVGVEDKSMYDISKYIKEYKDRENKCEYCAYHDVQGGRCYMCKNHDWFVQEINLKQYIIKRVSEDSTKEFLCSEKAIDLQEKVELRKNAYNNFNKYVEKQKEILDNELELKRKEWSDLQSEYAFEMTKYSCSNVDKALESLDSMDK